MYDLEGKLREAGTRSNGSLPYEFRALEAVLISVTTSLESEFEGVRDPVVKVLRELEEDIDRDKLRYLLIYSKKLGTFEQKARLVRDALDELLEADDDLAAMYLTEKAKGTERSEADHAEVELLLESYHKVADEIVQAAENLVLNIRNTEEMYVLPSSQGDPKHPSADQFSFQRPRYPRCQPQLAHAPRTALLHLHPRPRRGHLHRRPLRHEPQKLLRRIQPRILGRVRHVCSALHNRARVRPRTSSQSPTG